MGLNNYKLLWKNTSINYLNLHMFCSEIALIEQNAHILAFKIVSQSHFVRISVKENYCLKKMKLNIF
jgi:hypothetical protein